jgi:hypothetical protein
MDSMHKHLSNKCPVLFPNKAKVAISSGVVVDFEIISTAVAAHKEDSDSSRDDDKDNRTSEKIDSESSSEDDDDEGNDDDKDKGNSTDDDEHKKDKAKENSSKDDDSEEEVGEYGVTKQGTRCKYCVKKRGRCHLHILK